MEENLDAYRNYRGGPIPQIERYKFTFSKEALEAAKEQNFLKAARLKREIAMICRRQGREWDAHLLEVAAYNYLVEAYEHYGQTLDSLIDVVLKLQKHQRHEHHLHYKEHVVYFESSKRNTQELKSIPSDLLEILQTHLSLKADEAFDRGDDLLAATLKEILAEVCRRQGKIRDAHLLEVTARELRQK